MLNDKCIKNYYYLLHFVLLTLLLTVVSMHLHRIRVKPDYGLLKYSYQATLYMQLIHIPSITNQINFNQTKSNYDSAVGP